MSKTTTTKTPPVAPSSTPVDIEKELEALASSIVRDTLDPTRTLDTRTKIDALKAVTAYYATMQKVNPVDTGGSAFDAYKAKIGDDSSGSGGGDGSDEGIEDDGDIGADISANGGGASVVKFKQPKPNCEPDP